jgi:hypothetical protein
MIEIRHLLEASFRDIEIMLFQELSKHYLAILEQVLSILDELVYAERDCERFGVKDHRLRSVETLFGSLWFKRRYYRDHEAKTYVALLDEVLGLSKRARLSPGLTEAAICQGVNGPSYRGAESTLEAFYERPVVSHETIRQKVIDTGQLVIREEQRRQREVQGERQVPILFIEADGLYAHLQRDQQGGVEQRLALSHEGWQRRSGSDYELVNRQHYMAARGEDFWEAVSRQIYSRYDLEGAVIVINGDRASWIGQGVDYFADAAAVLLQWDRFHIARELRQILRNQPVRCKQALRAFRQSNSVNLLVELAVAESEEKDPKLKDAIKALREAVLEHPEAARDYRARLREKGFRFKGLRGLGAAESNMDRYANRLKKRGQSWRRYGLEGITAALTKHLEGRLRPYAQQVTRLQEQVRKLPQLMHGSAALARRVVDRVYQPRQGGLPATKMGRQGSGGLSHFLNRLSRPSPELA